MKLYKFKPMEWEKDVMFIGGREAGEAWIAKTPIGEFEINTFGGNYNYFFKGISSGASFSILEEAKAAAQKHFEEKMLEGLQEVDMKGIFSDLMKEQQEIISSPIRFNGVHVNKIKKVFEKHGFKTEPTF